MVNRRTKRKGCPQCGSRRFKLGPSSQPLAPDGLASLIPVRERMCKDCGIQYYPAMPRTVPHAFMLVGVALVLIGAMAFFEPLMKGPTRFRTWVKFAIVLGGLFFLGAGVQLFRKKRP